MHELVKGSDKNLSQQVQEACISSGFFYVRNHNVEGIEEAFRQAREFFDQPMEKKMLVDLHLGTSFKGYAPLMGEQVDPASRGDVHESWDMGSDSQAFSKEEAISGNLWPPADDLPAFRPALERVYQSIMDLGKRLFPIFAMALDLLVVLLSRLASLVLSEQFSTDNCIQSRELLR